MKETPSLTSLSDQDLLRRVADLLCDSRRTEADLVAHIGELDRRRLYAREACSSTFAYCTEVLHLSEHEAYLRITAARAARRHPGLLTMLADGRLHLSGIAKLAPHLTVENRRLLLQRATHRSKQQIEELIAELFPQPDAPALVRKLPTRQGHLDRDRAGVDVPTLSAGVVGDPADRRSADRPNDTQSDRPGGAQSGGDPIGLALFPGQLGPDRVVTPTTAAVAAIDSAARACIIEPLAPARYKVQFTASAELRDKLERLRVLMRSSVPDVDLTAVIDAAVTEKLERLEARRFARTAAPRRTVGQSDTTASSRHLPAAVRRAVHERDGGRCRYVDDQGRRCSARERLEYHHRLPYGRGGDHSAGNLCLMCHTHNTYLAEADYGRAAVGHVAVGVAAVGHVAVGPADVGRVAVGPAAVGGAAVGGTAAGGTAASAPP